MAQQRLLTLDIFRGLAIAGMVLVNNPGDWSHVYAPFRHAAWHGCTPTDLIFPSFLLIVGIAIAYSFKKFAGMPSAYVTGAILKRSALIFGIGLALNAFPFYDTDYSQLRVMGVLQRIGIAYGIAGLLVWSVDRRGLAYITIGILLGYWLLLVWFGGDTPYAPEGNLVQRIDLLVLGREHMYQGLGFAFDPEGLLGTVPAVATVLIGYQMGVSIESAAGRSQAAKRLLGLGIAGIAGGLLWSLTLPVNKPLWTGSFVIFSAGWGALLLAALIWVVDIKGYRAWSRPLIVFGVNPLFLYVLAWMLSIAFDRLSIGHVTVRGWVYRALLAPWAGPLNGSLLYAISFTAIIWLVGWTLYRKRIYIKI